MVLALLAAAWTAPAEACCAAIAGPVGAPLHRHATEVVALRVGKTTVLTLLTDVADPDGAASRLALIVPVDPTVTAVDVRPTLIEPVERLDALSAPRLTEWWHHDPCGTGAVPAPYRAVPRPAALPEPPPLPPPKPAPAPKGRRAKPAPKPKPPATPVPPPPYAEIAVLPWSLPPDAPPEAGPTLDRWLRDQKLALPDAARAELERLGQAGMRFAVARPSPEALVHRDGRTRLPPLRVRTRDDTLNLPLGVAATGGGDPQDVVVLVLAADRYAPTATSHTFAPTGLALDDAVIATFPEVWEGLFRAVTQPNIVVTEYAFPAVACDPCAVPALDRTTLAVLGGSLVRVDPASLVLTRLHLRLDAATSSPTLSLAPAGLAVGGTGAPDGLPIGAAASEDTLAFQTRLLVKHAFPGDVTCEAPDWTRWGGPPRGTPPPIRLASSQALEPVAPEGRGAVGALLRDPIVGVPPPPRSAAAPAPPRAPTTPIASGACRVGPEPTGALGIALAILLAALGSRRRG